MSFYSELATDVNELLAEFGQDVLVTSFELGEEDLSTGIVAQISTQFTVKGVLLDYDYRNFGDGTVSYQAVNTSDKRLLLNASTVVKPGDLLFVDNTLYKAYIIKAVNPARTRVLYDIWMQR